MVKLLIICEKPNVAERVAEALGKSVRKNLYGVNYYEVERDGNFLFIAPAVGHVFSLKQAEGEKKGSYPVFNIEWKPASEVSEKSEHTAKYLKVLENLAKKSDLLVNACDWDVEGELIGGNVIRFYGKKKESRRMYYSTLTKEDLLESFEKMEKVNENAVDAGETRHMLDWLWGINSSRALMNAIKKAGAFRIMSVGRVQGPALSVLAKREKEIKAFISKPYWELLAHCREVEFKHEKDRFFDEKEAKGIFDKCVKEKIGTVDKVERKKILTHPPFPFDLTSLQVEAYKVFGFAPTQTLQVSQRLYENALISYPRTSSQKLPAKLNLKKVITDLSSNQLFSKHSKQLIEKQRFKPHEGPKEDQAHPAIYPTGQKPGKLSEVEGKLYELIARRFLACFAPEAKRETMSVKLLIAQEPFNASGTRTIEEGWFDYYKPFLRLEEITLPAFTEQEEVSVSEVVLNQKETQPPKRFTQASIIKKLEELSLGTKSTRATIVQTLFDRGYAQGKSIEVTPLGMTVFEALAKNVPELTSEELTRNFEEEMAAIEGGGKKKEEVLEEGREALTRIMEEFKEKEEKIGKELFEAMKDTQTNASTLGKCNSCKGGNLMLRRSKYGIFVGCSAYPNCRNLFPLPKQASVKASGKVCEKCSTPIVWIRRKGKRPFSMCLDPKCVTKANWGKKSEEEGK